MRIDDLIITIAYFSIPVQLLVSLYHYPRLAAMPWTISVLCILFALFIFLCGGGHLLRCLGKTDGLVFEVLNGLTAAISMITALYLLPMIPSLMNLQDRKLEKETETKRKLMTFMSFLCHEIRNPLFAVTSSVDFLKDEKMTVEQEQSLTSIKQSARLMLRLVNDVLGEY